MDLVDWQQRFERWILTHHAQDDAAHDLSHFRRVWATATQLAAGEEVDRLVLLTACYFHDIVSLPKNHPERSRSSMMAAEKTLAILQSAFADFPADRYPAVSHAIEAHSFSAAIPPRTLEAKIVQDADRLESLGAIGLARVFAVAGALNTILFDAEDPFADRRALDDPKVIDGRHFLPQHRERIVLVGFRRDLQLHAGFTLRDIAAQYPAVRPTFGELLEPTVDAKFILTPVLWKYLYRYARKHQARGNGFGYGLVLSLIHI